MNNDQWKRLSIVETCRRLNKRDCPDYAYVYWGWDKRKPVDLSGAQLKRYQIANSERVYLRFWRRSRSEDISFWMRRMS